MSSFGSNLLVKQTSSVVFVEIASHLVFKPLVKVISNTLSFSSCGKFVPVKVILSFPKRFTSFKGLAADMVHAISFALTESAIGMLPFGVVTAGTYDPQVGFLSRVHSIDVPLKAPVAESVGIGLQLDLANDIDCNFEILSGRSVPVIFNFFDEAVNSKDVTYPTALMCIKLHFMPWHTAGIWLPLLSVTSTSICGFSS